MTLALLHILQPEPLPLSHPVHEHELREIEGIALTYNLWQLFYSQLRKHFSEDETVYRFLKDKEGLYRKNIVSSMQQEHIENTMLSLFIDRGIPACLIKGNEIARKVYLDPNTRVSGDIDILIREQDIFDADLILTTRGYRREDSLPLAFWLKRLHHAQYFHEEQNSCIEIHWNFTYPSFFKLGSDDIWKEITRDDCGHYNLSPRMMVISSFIHHYRHVFMDLRTLVDVLWTLYRYDREIDWIEFVERCRQIGMVKTADITLRQLSHFWPEEYDTLESVKILMELMPAKGYLMSRYLFRKLQIDCAGMKTTGTMKDVLLTRFALDSWMTIGQSFLKAVIPSPQVINALYNEQRVWFLPPNYVRFLFWRLREWIGRSR